MITKETAAFIIPHYNDGNDTELDWLIKALNSIKNQTDKNLSLIHISEPTRRP